MWACAAILAASTQSQATEPRVIYDKPIYPGEIVEPRLRELLPPDAATYAIMYRLCLHWGGEPAYDQERAEEIDRGIAENCTGLEAKRDSLRLKYPPGSSVASTLRRVIADLDSFSDNYAWDDPRHHSVLLNHYYEAWAQQAGRHVDALIARRHALSDTVGAATRNMLRVMSANQTRWLRGLLKQIDRLHPQTVAELRAACVRWERETGEKIISK
jgi:hypothetical protein